MWWGLLRAREGLQQSQQVLAGVFLPFRSKSSAQAARANLLYRSVCFSVSTIQFSQVLGVFVCTQLPKGISLCACAKQHGESEIRSSVMKTGKRDWKPSFLLPTDCITKMCLLSPRFETLDPIVNPFVNKIDKGWVMIYTGCYHSNRICVRVSGTIKLDTFVLSVALHVVCVSEPVVLES